MNELLGFSVRIFIPTGEPESLRIIEKSTWTGQSLIFPVRSSPKFAAGRRTSSPSSAIRCCPSWFQEHCG